jgi:hypothetical protein
MELLRIDDQARRTLEYLVSDANANKENPPDRRNFGPGISFWTLRKIVGCRAIQCCMAGRMGKNGQGG